MAVNLFNRAKTIREAKDSRSLETADSIAALAKAHLKAGHLTTASALLPKALAIRSNLAPNSLSFAHDLEVVADLARLQRRFELARRHLVRAHAIVESLASGSQDEAQILFSRARLEQDADQLKVALSFYEAACRAIEIQASRLGGTDVARALFRAGIRPYYLEFIDVLVRLGLTGRAFEIAENARAQTLLEALRSAQVNVGEDIAPELSERKQRLQLELSEKLETRLRQVSTDAGGTALDKLNDGIEKASQSIDDLESEIRARTPRYRAFMTPEVVNVDHVREQLLDHDTALIEYVLGDEFSHVFVVTHSGVTARRLRGRGRIEPLARSLYGILTTRREYQVICY